MKKLLITGLLLAVALAVFTGSAAAQGSQPGNGTLHDYMVQALAEKLNLPVATVQSQIDSGKTMAQIALENGVTQADLPAFLLQVRTTAIGAALKNGVITQTWAERMLKRGGRGMGGGMGAGTGACGGTGIPVGSGMQRGMRWQQVNP